LDGSNQTEENIKEIKIVSQIFSMHGHESEATETFSTALMSTWQICGQEKREFAPGKYL